MSTVVARERTAEIDEIRIPEPLWSVKSRVSWGALLAGAVVAIALYSLLSMLGVALAVTLSERLNAEQLGTFAAVWTFVTLLAGMFAGGFASTRCTAGELRNEGMLYGIIVWGVASLVLIPLSAAGIGASVGTVLASRGISAAKNEISPAIVNAQYTVSTKVDELKDAIAGSENSRSTRKDRNAKSETSADEKSNSDDSSTSDSKSSVREEASTSDANDSDQSRTASSSKSSDQSQASDGRRASRGSDAQDAKSIREKAISASWWAFGGTFSSMLMAVLGAMVGPSITVVRHKVPVRSVPVTPVQPGV